MNDLRCCPTNRRSLAERVEEIIRKYEKSCPSGCPGGLRAAPLPCEGRGLKVTCPRPLIPSCLPPVPRTSCKRFQCPSRPSSACGPCERPKCQPKSKPESSRELMVCPSVSTSLCSPCVKFSPQCPEDPCRLLSSCDIKSARKTWVPISCTSIEIPEVCPGPNLQRYLSSRGICPSLKGKLLLYEDKRPSDPCPRPICPETPRPSPTKCICDDFKLKNRCKCTPPKIPCPPIVCAPISCGDIMPSCEKPCGTTEPPFSSPTLEREFTSRFVKRLASELIFIDKNENLARAEAEDIGHVAGFLGNPKIVGTKDYSLARDATVCVVTACAGGDRDQPGRSYLLDENLKIFQVAIPKICKYAPNCVLVIVTHPVDILSYAAMKLSGFPPNRVIGLGTFLDSCRFQYLISRKLGISASSVQALIVGENGPTSVPVWSTVSVMGIKLKDINQEIGSEGDPESWSVLHDKVIESSSDISRKKGCCNWGLGICASEIVDAIVRNTCVCITVSTFVQGCRHGLEKDIFMSLPCIISQNGVHSYVRHLYTKEEQEQTLKSCKNIYEAQRPILDLLE